MNQSMNNSDDYKPVLQIVHFSDMHFVHNNTQATNAIIKRRLERIPVLGTMIKEGMAHHDTSAPDAFRDFLQTITRSQPWNELTTWLIDTGDLTTYGDYRSLQAGRNLLDSFRQAANGSQLFTLHGNHDAWPENFPLMANNSEIDTHRANLRSLYYPQRWPEQPFSLTIPNNQDRQIQLYGLNSVIHGKIFNAFALGQIKEDCYWENQQSSPRNDFQIQQLEQLIDGNQNPMQHFRILATHHPVHYPPPRPNISKFLMDDNIIGNKLNASSPQGAQPLIHLALSGHTHSFFPEHGLLPNNALSCQHPTLGNDQCQLVVGSLMQDDPTNIRGVWAHQCQVLRFYYSGSDPNKIIIERLMAARQNGVGDYQFVPVPNRQSPA